jgi:hypothetical protein
LRNIKNNEGHFILITYWENLEVIKNFAGEDFEKAKYYPEDDYFLLEFEEKVEHFEVFSKEKFQFKNSKFQLLHNLVIPRHEESPQVTLQRLKNYTENCRGDSSYLGMTKQYCTH